MKMNAVMKMFGVFGLLAFLAAGDIWATPTIEVTKAQQRYPWNNKIDVDYASAGLEVDHTYALSVILECAAQGLAKTVSTDVVIQNRTSVSGTTVVDIDTVAAEFQGLTLASGDLTVAVALADRGALDTDNGVTFVPGDYLIVDLQDGTVTPSNNVAVASAFQDVVYKTTKMVFRKVPAGSFMMQATGAGTGTKVEIPQDYYLAIYPCTQGQYKQLAGGALPPAIYQGHDYGGQKETGDTYPCGWVQWNQVAGGTAASSDVDSDILTILNGRMAASGYTAALPNEAQWERAARAGTTTTYFFGSSSSSGLGLGAYASYGVDADPANQTFGIVGGKLPNAWGFYDVYGNVWEWCSDAYEGEVGDLGSGFWNLQPGGSAGTPNSQRVQRGGSYSNGGYPNYLSSTFRCYWVSDAAWYNGGFRLALAGGITRFLSEAVVCPADTRDGVRVINSVDELLPITYSGSNWGDGSGTATVTYSQNGAAATTFVDAASSTATQAWTPTDQGTYQFTHSSTAAGATDLSATFIISGVPIASASVSSLEFDTRLWWPRRPESVDQILPFAHDMTWTNDTVSIVKVSIAPYKNADDPVETVEVRRETVSANQTTTGTGIWTPIYGELYQAQIIREVSGNVVVTNTVDIDLRTCPGMKEYKAVRVTFADGTTQEYKTLAEALEAYRANDGERFELIANCGEDLVLAAGDDLVFEGNDFLLEGSITVPSDADLTILDGRFTADPTAYLPTQGTTQPASAVDGVWTVDSLWQVGAAKPADVKAYLDDGNLVFIGGGDMMGWGAAAEKLPPWDAYDSQVTNAVVRRLVTSVGSEAFSNCVNMVSATLPGTIQDVGRSAFAVCNTSGTGVEKGAGFVKTSYEPDKTGVTDPFEMCDMRAVDGKLIGGTYNYNPEEIESGHTVNEVADGYQAYSNGNGTWTIGEVWATNATTGTKYGAFETAITEAADEQQVNLTRGIAYTTAEFLNAAFAEKGNLTIGGDGTLDVWGTLERGKYECAIRLSDKIGLSEITGGDFYGPVYTKDGAISGGTFSIRPDDSQIKEGYVIVETSDEPARYRVVEMPLNGVAYPKVVENISYTGENLVGVLASSGVVLTSGVTNAVDVGVYTAKVDVAEGKCWPTGGDEQVTLVWGIAPALPGVVTGYDPNLGEEGGWRITLTNDVTGPLTIPDSFGEKVHGAVVLDLNGFTIKGANGTQPAETADGHPGLVISHTPDYEGPALDLTIEGPGSILGGDGADGDPANHEGGDGAPAVVVEEGASLTEGTPKEDTTKGAITKSPGEDGSDYVPEPGEPSGLLVTIVDSRDEYLALAIPYANTNSPAGTAKPTLDSLVRKAELAAGDAVYIHNPANKQIAKYVLDAEKYWHPVPVVEVTERGWTSVLGQMPCELEPGYGFWLQRGAASRPNKVYLWGHEWTGWSGAWTVTIDASTTVAGKAVRGKTLIGSPYHDAWDLNDTTRVNWSGIAENGDWIQTEGGAGMIYKYYNGQWKPYSLGAKMKPIPAGCGFWYIRAAGKGSATLVFAAEQ